MNKEKILKILEERGSEQLGKWAKNLGDKQFDVLMDVLLEHYNKTKRGRENLSMAIHGMSVAEFHMIKEKVEELK